MVRPFSETSETFLWKNRLEGVVLELCPNSNYKFIFVTLRPNKDKDRYEETKVLRSLEWS
jgi:hypothetical protein